MAIELRRIRADEWRELRDLRLRALLDAPDAFGSTYEREAEEGEQEWLGWAADGAKGGSSFTVVAVDDGRWIGLAVGAPDRDHPGQAGLFAMWVDPGARGSAIGHALVDRRLADGREYIIVKHFYEPAELVAALDDAGWDADIMTSGVHFLYGTARPR